MGRRHLFFSSQKRKIVIHKCGFKMPFVRCVYSGFRHDVEEALARELSRVIAAGMGKPESRVFVQAEHKRKLLFGGSLSPCAMIQIDSIGGSLAEHCETITSTVQRVTGVPADRVFMNFVNFTRDCFAREGKTLENSVRLQCKAQSKPMLLAKL